MSNHIQTKNISSLNPSSSASSTHRNKSRWVDSKTPTNPNSMRAPPPDPPPPLYDFPGLERRTIVLYDGTVRSYFAVPPDDPPVGPAWPLLRSHHQEGGGEEDYWTTLGLNGPRAPPAPSLLKRRKLDGEEEEDDKAWLRESVRRYGNPNAEHTGFVEREFKRPHAENNSPALVGNVAEARTLKDAFLTFSKLINENLSERMTYLEDGKNGPLWCIVCGRTSNSFAGVHDLIMHAYTSQITDLRIDHLGLHKALCVLMGWNYAKAPETSKAYQSLSADEAAANMEELIVWPPTVIIHNTNTGRRKDGRTDGMNNEEVESKLKELGFAGGMAKSLYGKGGHLGIAAVKFASTQAGLKEAERLVEYFKKGKHGREEWAHVEASLIGDDEKNPALVEVDEETGEKKKIFYGYLATASDLEKVDIDTRKKAIIKSRREFDL